MAREPSRSLNLRQYWTAHPVCARDEPPPNPQLVASLLDRSNRERTRLFWAEGCRSFLSAVENRWPIRAVVYCPKLLRSPAAWQDIRRIPASRRLKATEDEFVTLSRRREPDGIGVVCPQRWERLIDQNAARGDVWVGLDSLRTPGNLGTILRTCAAVGVRGVMLIGGESDPYDPAAIRASMGAVFSVPLVRTSGKALAGWRARREILIVGTSPAASLDYRTLSYPTPLVLLMGSERTGLRDRQIALCDDVVSLPMTSRVDSLNLAVATSVMLYEIVGRHTR